MTEALTGTQAIGELGRYFPGGFRAKTANEYVARLYRDDFIDADIAEGVSRVIATRTQRTFPAYAELLGHCSEARSLRERSKSYGKKTTGPAWLNDPRVGSGNCRCNHGLGVHGPPEGGNGEPTLTGACRFCECGRYTAGPHYTKEAS